MFEKKFLVVLVSVGVATLSGCGGGDSATLTTTPVAADPYLVSNWYAAGSNNRSGVSPELASNGLPTASSPDLQDAAYAISGASLGAGFVDTDYIGAFPQDATDNWSDGWTVGLNGNKTVWEPAVTPVADGTCPAGTTLNGSLTLPSAVGGGSMDLCTLAAAYTTDGSTIALTADNIYELASGSGTFIGNGNTADGDTTNDVRVTLDIAAGTLILGGSQEALVITRGSSVNAVGTAADPIVMTSRTQFDRWVAGGDGTSDRGEWAGFALMGYAQTNECGTPCDVVAEGGIGYYGGTVDSDSSGTVKYVVIRQAGNDLDGNGNELNGFTLFGVGSGTVMDYIQVHKGLDDGIEHFGSADFMSHIVLTDNADDSFDWGQGYTGGAQFIVVKQAADVADRGIEADNDKANPQAGPISMPILANMTFMGQPAGDSGADGILLRRGTGAIIWNTIVTGFADACIDIDDDATFARAGASAPATLSGELVMNNSVVSCSVNFDEE